MAPAWLLAYLLLWLLARDNGKLNEHWREHGFRVVDEHGHLVRKAVTA